MKPLHLRFDSEQSAVDALIAHGFTNDNGNWSHPKCEIFIVGVICGAPIYDDNFEISGYEPDLLGYHVNLLVPDDYIPPPSSSVISVKTPSFKWAGYD